MPVSPTYPGVYIQEVDSGSRVVSGVATSITAFIGRCSQGPANSATTVFDYGEFETLFGGRMRDLPMTYAVDDFFNNGGSQAVIVRVCAGPPLGGPATLSLVADPPLTVTTGLRGTIANEMKLIVAEHDTTNDPDKTASYDVSLELGPKIVLAAIPKVAPEAFLMTLQSLSDWISVTGTIDADGVTKLFPPTPPPGAGAPPPAPGAAPALQSWPKAFAGGSDQKALTGAVFQAGDLHITASIGGSWADDLAVSLVPTGAGKFTFVADHPLFSTPLDLDFTTWAELQTALAATELFTLATPPTFDIAPFVQKGIPLTRIPDAAGAAAALLTFGPLVLTASSPGAWGNQVGVFFDKKNIGQDVALRYVDYGIETSTDFWNVNVVYPIKKGQTQFPIAETIGPVYLGPLDAPCRIDHVLEQESDLLAAHQPVAAPAGAQLLQDPKLVGQQDPKSPNQRLGVLSGGQDGETLSSDIVIGSESARSGMFALQEVDLFNILVVPPDPLLDGDPEMSVIYDAAAAYCASRRAILIADPPDKWGFSAKKSQFDKISPTDFNIGEIGARRSVFTYFPRIKKLDPEYGNRERVFSASGMIAGIFAATDVRRGVWKAPAGIEAGMNGVTNLEYRLTDMQNGILNQVGVNVLRDFPVIGKVIWGSRTLAGADALSDDYKYLPVRRLTNYIEESLLRGTKFAVFEPNAEPLWSQLRLTIGAFMTDLSRQGAFYDYFVLCDTSTTTQYDIDRGRVNVTVAFAPVKPAEFVILTIQQLAGQTAA